LALVCDAPAHFKQWVWHLSTTKRPFHYIIRSVTTSSSCWCDVCRRWYDYLSPVGLSCFFFPLSSPEKYSLVLFVVAISNLDVILLIFNFCSWPFVKVLFFLIHHSISICHIFILIWSLFFISIFFLALL
jgi:hypothetical protein